ncbi:MAG TPA: NHL repeat-containing protein [Planctomycetota bacterium]
MRALPAHLIVPLLVLSAPLSAQKTQAARGEPGIPGKLLVSGFGSDALHGYRAHDGAVRGSIAVAGPQCIVRGPDQQLYVCAEKIDRVLRLDPETLQAPAPFVWDDPGTPADENGPLDGPTAAVFGPDGDLYVASFETDQILRFDGHTGAYEGIFVAAGSGGLNGPDAGTKFGSDGNLYVPSFWNDRVLRYDADGAFVDEFVSFREGTLRQPRDLVEHEGHWYVASSFNDRILRFDLDGVYVDIFATLNQPYSLAFNPHDGDLYAVSLANNAVRRFEGTSGQFVEALVPGGTGGILGAVYLFFLE